ncbi:PQQ-binding-like beta-propeller repeat protein [Gordonia sp. 'Campus']|uniref:outer membrane protein assembly factor BamB family protein n=1 Tax=Gordonia sp. 'Campus' TaxID=2915824 RepID=UPI001EE48ACA|nr:PQQ-binding-like beta-propeller repeat protein [Gordonia sp. 'Campus']
MGYDEEHLETTVVGTGTRWRAAVAGVALGMSIGAVGLAAYAFLNREAHGILDLDAAPATVFTGAVLSAVIVVAVLILVSAELLRRGVDLVVWIGWLLAAVVVGVFVAFSDAAAGAASAALDGTDAAGVVSLAQAATIGTAVSVVVLLATAAPSSPPTLRFATSLSSGTLALTVVLAAGTAIVSAATPIPYPVAAPIGIPPVPTVVGNEVGYRVSVEQGREVLPAGPGFVVRNHEAVTGYDGATGTPRWSVAGTAIPGGCMPTALWSTGISPDSTVVMTCSAGRDDQQLVAIDAMTGSIRWIKRASWEPMSSVAMPDAVVGVVHRSAGEDPAEEFGALDLATGEVLWKRSASCDHGLEQMTSTSTAVVVVEQCESGDLETSTREATVHIYDSRSGRQKSIPVPPLAELPPADTIIVSLVAAFEEHVLLKVNAVDTSGLSGVLLLDSHEATLQGVPVAHGWIPRVQTGSYPGQIAEVASSDNQHPDFIEVMDMTIGSPVRIPGVSTIASPERRVTAHEWAKVGEFLVGMTALGEESIYDDRDMIVVGAGGRVERRPSPCGADGGGVLAVPGAVLVRCPRDTADGKRIAVDVVGLR